MRAEDGSIQCRVVADLTRPTDPAGAFGSNTSSSIYDCKPINLFGNCSKCRLIMSAWAMAENRNTQKYMVQPFQVTLLNYQQVG